MQDVQGLPAGFGMKGGGSTTGASGYFQGGRLKSMDNNPFY